MLKLRDLQAQFAHTLFIAAETGLLSNVVGAGIEVSERLDIYRNNVLSNYRNALRDTYPVIVRLVGDEFFNAAARTYAKGKVSTSGDLHDFGQTFGDFLRDYAPARELPYLPDVARLEWSCHRVFHALDPAPLDVSVFAHLDEKAFSKLKCELRPSAQLLASDYPVLRIWQISQPDYSGDDSVALDEGADRLLITRRDYVVEVRRLAAVEYSMLKNLSDGCTLGQAVDIAQSMDGLFDLQQFLSDHILAPTLNPLF